MSVHSPLGRKRRRAAEEFCLRVEDSQRGVRGWIVQGNEEEECDEGPDVDGDERDLSSSLSNLTTVINNNIINNNNNINSSSSSSGGSTSSSRSSRSSIREPAAVVAGWYRRLRLGRSALTSRTVFLLELARELSFWSHRKTRGSNSLGPFERFFQQPFVWLAGKMALSTPLVASLDDEGKLRTSRSSRNSLGIFKVLCLIATVVLLAVWLLKKAPVQPGVKYGAAWERSIIQSAKPSGRGHPVILVTGSAGFVGYHVSLALKKRGDGVVGIDNFNDYYPVQLKRARAANLLSKGVVTVDGDINNSELLRRMFKLVQFTHVLHLAAQAGVRYAVKKPMTYVHSNIAGFVVLLEVCKSLNPQPSMIFASSSSVYGLNTKVPFSEDDRTDQPASLYAATKKADEMIAHTYNHIWGLSITALRFFTVYGPWGRPDMAYFSFTRNIVEETPIKIFRGPYDTELSRDFTYIADVVKGCVASIDTAKPSTGSGGKKTGSAQFRIFNLGNTQPVKVGAFVDILEKHLNRKAIRDYVDMPATGDVPFTHANVSHAREELGYNPTTDLETGLGEFVTWFSSYYGDDSMACC
ncbi:hypothetical protein CBR_g38213 [Chara braunii]|uniref:UDP-glucuronate 4-epimerase n=1 Tax=Chara braunii TaxID=69332 RepID=A0A388LPV6_CHABU|nr:hypothetical protein CBR_g38213 [Chara braunii]|eukprot:GBG84242.1 hypothetical protein CBR_g38213 [Chara braunii]